MPAKNVCREEFNTFLTAIEKTISDQPNLSIFVDYNGIYQDSFLISFYLKTENQNWSIQISKPGRDPTHYLTLAWIYPHLAKDEISRYWIDDDALCIKKSKETK